MRENVYKGNPGSVKMGARRRICPMPVKLVEELRALKQRGHHVEPDDYVFCHSTGHFIKINNFTKRVFKPAAKHAA